ncbi:FimV/HubP family polar landmark protein [Rheinheimera gaetbuli]
MKQLPSVFTLLLFAAFLTANLPARAAPGGSNIIVAPGETLWRIANRVRPDNDVAVVQVIYALWQANPALHQALSLHQLTSGSQLQVPPRSVMLQTPEAKARQWYNQALARSAPSATAQLHREEVTGLRTILPTQTGEHHIRTDVTAQTPAKNTPAQTYDLPAAEPQKITPAPWYQDIQADYTFELQQRYYSADGAQGQSKHYSSAALSADWYWQSADRRHQLSLKPYARWDVRDPKRSLLDLRQAYWQYVGDGFDIKAGVDIVFWGVTESQHLVDVINQTDTLANIDAETKLGQPMLNWNLHGAGGSLSLYVLPYFRERPQAGPDGRLRPALLVDSNNPQYESGQQDKNLDFALRYSQQFGAVDLGLSYFEGNNREPLYNLTAAGLLQPVYLQMQQLGIDSLWISGSWLWKLESIYRKTRQQDFVAATAGFEYTWVGLFDSNWDLGWIAEYQYDSRGSQATAPGQNDVFIGGRFVANDAAGSEILLGLLQDLDHSGSQSGKLEASMRLSNSLRLRLDAWFFHSERPTEPAYAIRNDDYLQLSLDYYF